MDSLTNRPPYVDDDHIMCKFIFVYFRASSSEDKDEPPPKEIYRKPPPCMCDVDQSSIDPAWPQPRIVIIGAGVAGLTAACRLAKRGIDNFVILEAYNRFDLLVYLLTLSFVKN